MKNKKIRRIIKVFVVIYLIESILISFSVIGIDYLATKGGGINNRYRIVVSDELYKKFDSGYSCSGGMEDVF